MTKKNKKKRGETASMMDLMVQFTQAMAVPQVSSKLFAKAPCWLWSPRGDRVIWANEAGIRFFKTKSLPDLLDRQFRGISPASAAISRVGRREAVGFRETRLLRYLFAMKPADIQSRIELLDVPHIGKAVWVESLDGDAYENKRPIAKAALRFVKMCSRGSAPAAFLSETGEIREASNLFYEEKIGTEIFQAMIQNMELSGLNWAAAKVADHIVSMTRTQNAGSGEETLFFTTYARSTQLGKVKGLLTVDDLTVRAADEPVESQTQPEEDPAPEETQTFTAEDRHESLDFDPTPAQEAAVESPDNVVKEPFDRKDEETAGADDQEPEEIEEASDETADLIQWQSVQEPVDVSDFSSDDDERHFDDSEQPTSPIPLENDTEKPQESSAEQRFLFELDPTGEFISISPEFQEVLGQDTGDILHTNLFDLVRTFNLDPEQRIEAKFSQKVIWNQMVLWPVSGTGKVGQPSEPPDRLPVGLTAMPVFDRYRNFEGFRGFGHIKHLKAAKHPDSETFGRMEISAEENEEVHDRDWESFLATTPLGDEGDGEKSVDHRIDEEPTDLRIPFKDLDDLDFSEDGKEAENTDGERQEDSNKPSNVMSFPQANKTALADKRSVAITSTVSDITSRLSKPEQRAFEQIALALGKPKQPAEDPSNERERTEEKQAAELKANVDTRLEKSHLADRNDFTDIDFSAANAIEGVSNRPIQKRNAATEGTNAETNAAGQGTRPQASAEVHADKAQDNDTSDAMNANQGPATDPFVALLNDLPFAILISRNRKLLFANRKLLSFLDYPDQESLDVSGGINTLFCPTETTSRSSDLEDTDPLRQLVLNADDATDEDPPTQKARLQTSGQNTMDMDVTLLSGEWQGHDALIMVMQPSVRKPEEKASAHLSHDQILGQSTGIMDIASDGILILDENGKLIHANISAEVLFGTERSEMYGLPITHLFAEESVQAIQDYLEGLKSNGVASVLNDGREVIGQVRSGGLIPLFMTIGQIGRNEETDLAIYCAVLRDITQWKAAEDELIHSRKAAEDANAQKSDFLARISHEIRTPLNAIIGFSEVMMHEHFGKIENPRYLEYVHDIHTSGTLLVSLVNDLLDLSKIEAGKVDLSFSSVTLNPLIQECVAIMQPDANRERIIIRTSMAGDLPPVVADPRSIRQIVLNLLSNAIKFTDPAGQVIVSTTLESDGEVAIRVRDTGIGMTERDLEQAMQPFKQVAAATRKGQSGTGLGLPLTKALVEANKARFSIHSRPDYGTLIQVTFPNERVLAH